MNLTEHYTWGKHNNLTSVTDAMGRKTVYTYDLEQNLTSVTDASGRTEQFTYDAGSRRTSYTMNGGNSIRYDYDALNDLVEKTYLDENGETEETIGSTVSGENPSGVLYGYDLSGQRVSMMDTSGDSVYTYDGLGRITSVTTYRKPAQAGADTADKEDGETVRYEYDGCDQLAAIIYPDGTRVSYAYDKNDNLTAVTDRNGKTTTYVYDAINRVTEIHRPNGISTYNAYNARDQIVSLKNTCDECGWVVSQYDYTYDDNGYIATEKAVESLYDYAWDDRHNGKHEDGRHDDKMPHGTKHNGKHDKDSEYHFQLVETDREFTYDENGRLLSSREQEENSGLTTYDYTYDAVGNRLSYVKRTQTTKHPNKTDVAESAFYQYNDANQLVSAKLFDGKKNTTVDYTYDENGNLISEIGKYGTDQVETYYDYTVENRLQAVYDADELLMAAAYDGDGNRVFQLNYNLHTDEDWKDNSGNGNGNNKDNAGSGNNGNGNSSSGNNSNNGNGNGSSGNNGNGSTGNNGNPGNSGNGKGDGNTGNNGNGNGNGNNKENSKSEGTDDAGYGNATNAEEHNSQNQSGILFPIAEEISSTETDLIAMIKTTGKEKNYELIEYILNVNTQYTQVLMELNENGAMDAAYTYGVSRLTEDRFTGESNFYLYDPAGNVAGITDQDGYLWQSYRYDAFGNATFGSPQYDNEYTFNAESYNPNIQSQYLRARYYDMVKGNFLTEDSYLGDIRNPLTLNRYGYCIGNPLFYIDPSGHKTWQDVLSEYTEEGMDTYGIAIGYWYLYGDGKDFVVNESGTNGSWTRYMEKNNILTGKVGDVVIPIGNNLEKSESIEIDMSFSMIIQNGEGATGYMFMHGTNEEVGGFQIKGTISKDGKGKTTYDLTYTWNDVMDPFPEAYTSDAQKAEIAKQIPFANPQDYKFHLTWSDKTIIYEEESFFKRNKGWLKNWNEDWYNSLSREEQGIYDEIDYEQIIKFGALSWIEHLVQIREEYSAYYGC